jgi:hypothetical protein
MEFDKLDYINSCLIQLKYNGVQSIITNGPIKYKETSNLPISVLKNEEIHSYVKANNIIEG